MSNVACMTVARCIFPDDRPSPIFSTFTCLINLIGIIWDIVVMNAEGCASSSRIWLIAGLGTHFINFVFAIYFYLRLTQKVRTRRFVWHSTVRIVVWDIGSILYAVFLVWILVWVSLAIMYQQQAKAKDQCAQTLIVGVAIDLIYMVGGFALVAFTIVTECCNVPAWQQRQRDLVEAVDCDATPQRRRTHTIGLCDSDDDLPPAMVPVQSNVDPFHIQPVPAKARPFKPNLSTPAERSDSPFQQHQGSMSMPENDNRKPHSRNVSYDRVSANEETDDEEQRNKVQPSAEEEE